MSFEHFSAPLSRIMNRAQTGLAFDDFSRCESPIEGMFQLALSSASRHLPIRWCAAQTLEELDQCALPPDLVVGSQVWAGSFRLDFAIARGAGHKPLGVECDGEKHHHGSKKGISSDARRDRELADRDGVSVLRLRGADIYRNPLGAVQECLLALYGEDRIYGVGIALRQCRPVDATHYAAVERCAKSGDYSPLASLARKLTDYKVSRSSIWQDQHYTLPTERRVVTARPKERRVLTDADFPERRVVRSKQRTVKKG